MPVHIKKSLGGLFFFVLGLLVAAALAETILRFMPVTMGLYRTQIHDQWPLQGYGKHQAFSYSLGWQMLFPNRGRTNNYGQHAGFDYLPRSKPILVIGDSFVEAQMVPFADTLQGALNRLMAGSVPVYGFGFAGNSFAEYLAVARMARAEFAPTALVFVIVHNDVKESWSNRLGHRYFEIDGAEIREGYQPLDRVSVLQRLRSVFGESALYRYVQINLGFTVDRVLQKHRAQTKSVPGDAGAGDAPSRQVVDYFLSQLPLASGVVPGNIWFVLDADRERIYDPGQRPFHGVDSADVQRYFRDRARALGYRVFDTEPVFRTYFAREKRRVDFTPVDRHWNGTGHTLAAEGLYPQLRAVLCNAAPGPKPAALCDRGVAEAAPIPAGD